MSGLYDDLPSVRRQIRRAYANARPSYGGSAEAGAHRVIQREREFDDWLAAELDAHTPPSESATGHVVHVTAVPVAEDVVWCEECEEWVTSGAPACEDGAFGSQDIADALGGRGPLDPAPVATGATTNEDELAQHFKVCDCHDSWDQCPCAEGGHPADASCGCCPRGTGLCGPLPTPPPSSDTTIEAEVKPEGRAACLERWPEAWANGYDPNCCRWPKSCSIEDEPDAPPPASDTDRDTGLSEAERGHLDRTDAEHDYPTETDDGLVMRCRCGATPPGHYLGQQVDEALWLWEHRRRERYAAVERILAARARVQPEGNDRVVTKRYRAVNPEGDLPEGFKDWPTWSGHRMTLDIVRGFRDKWHPGYRLEVEVTHVSKWETVGGDEG